jgi:hypothetical protein
MVQDTFLFDTTHHAIWAEEVAEERAIPAEVIAAPKGTGAKCNLALRTLPDRADELAEALQGEGIEFRRWAQT